jgi:hypothetical protein
MTALHSWTDAALELAARYEQTRRVADLDRAIALFSRVVRAGTDIEPNRAGHRDNLGVALLSRYEATADVAALRQALACSRAATASRFAGHPDHALHLSNLCNTALAWFDETHDAAVLDEAVAAGTAAVRIGGEDEELFRETRRAALVRRFEQHVASAVEHATAFDRNGSAADLNAAVEAGRAALADVPDDEPRGWVAWSTLSDVLRRRFEVLGAEEDLSESVAAGRAALELAEHGGDPVPDRPYPPAGCAVNLGAALLTRLLYGGPVDDADEAIEICRAMAAREQTPERDRRLLLSHVVGALQERAGREPAEPAARADLDDAVAVCRDLVDRAEPRDRGVDLSNLANCLLARARDDGDGDVTEAIECGDEAVRILPTGTQEWARAVATRATALSRRWQATRDDADAAAAVAQRLGIVRSSMTAAAVRIAAARDAATLAHRWGRPRVALEAAKDAVALLPIVAWRGLTWPSRAGQLTNWQNVAVDAAALAAPRPADAAVLVEHGRGVLWTQMLDARRDLDEVQGRAPELAERLSRIGTQLDAGFAPQRPPQVTATRRRPQAS